MTKQGREQMKEESLSMKIKDVRYDEFMQTLRVLDVKDKIQKAQKRLEDYFWKLKDGGLISRRKILGEIQKIFKEEFGEKSK